MRAPIVSWAVLAIAACRPEIDVGDVWPRNCDREGPVTLFESDALALDAGQVGDHVVAVELLDEITLEYSAIDRCGQSRVRLPAVNAMNEHYLIAGAHLLRCDEDTGAVDYVDPTGTASARPLFPPIDGCRVLPAGEGLVAQERGGQTVWFHPAPADPDVGAIVVTTQARRAQADAVWICVNFSCETLLPFAETLGATGAHVLAGLASGPLVAFDTRSGETSTLVDDLVRTFEVLPGGTHVVADLATSGTIVASIDGRESFPFCCYDDVWKIERFGEWIVKDYQYPGLIPAPEVWTVLRAHDLRSGTTYEIDDDEGWDVLARVDADSLLVELASPPDPWRHAIVEPATGERREVVLPGDLVWSVPGRDGAFAWHTDDEQTFGELWTVADARASPERLLEGVRVEFPTQRGRIVLRDLAAEGDAATLSVWVPQEQLVEIDHDVVGVASGDSWDEEWVAERDEVLYVVRSGDEFALRRTVLP